MCLLTHEKYKADQTGFSFGRLGHAPGVGLGGTVGEGVNFFPKFNQIWCVRKYMNGTCTGAIFWAPLVPWGGAKRSNNIKSELQRQFQRFLNQTHKTSTIRAKGPSIKRRDLGKQGRGLTGPLESAGHNGLPR